MNKITLVGQIMDDFGFSFTMSVILIAFGAAYTAFLVVTLPVLSKWHDRRKQQGKYTPFDRRKFLRS